ncbi:MAG TPA: transcription termination/antitermination protein NusA [Candidatus Avilachnospira avicola]|nr:transcription termination/antitermination protein NusA [Candidatus Avilachnospira avicola]
MNNELRDALEILGKERNIPKEALLKAIEDSLLTACKNHFGKAENCIVNIDRDTYEYNIIQKKTVVENVTDPVMEISLPDALTIDRNAKLGDTVDIQIDSQKFGRIATQNAKGVIVQKIREEERNSLYRDFFEHEHEVMTGVVQRFFGKNVSVNLGKADAILSESEQIKTETLKPNQRIKVYVLEVKNNPRGPRISVSRTHPDLVKKLFEQESSEVRDGIVEIMAIAREAGSRTKMAVVSHDENVDPVGACVGVNGTRVNSVVDELGGEKIDIINWDDNPAYLIENALSPAKVIVVVADEDAKEAEVIVPDNQLSLAIGKEGQNARLAAKLTGFKIDIKSETQAQELGLFDEFGISSPASYEEEDYGYEDDEMYEGYDEEDIEAEEPEDMSSEAESEEE